MTLRRTKELSLGGVGLSLAVDERHVQRVRTSRLYQLLRRRNGVHQERGRNGHAPTVAGAPAPGAASAPLLSPEARQAAERVGALNWYHVIDLPHGIQTPGRIDLRPEIDQYGLPRDMRGMRALDVATFDGFLAFEMERRGAEVIATDLARGSQADWPARMRAYLPPEHDVTLGAGFRLAKELLGSSVERREVSVYDLSPETVGTFDFVLISDLLQHLRDPARALEAAFRVVRSDGCLVLAEVYEPALEPFRRPFLELRENIRYTWSMPSTAALSRMLNVAGFVSVEEIARPDLSHSGDLSAPKIVLRARPSADARAAPSPALKRRLAIGGLEIRAGIRRRRGSAGVRPSQRATDAAAAKPPATASPESPQPRTTQERVNAIDWYHVMDLPGVVTPGKTDHRREVHRYGLPERMDGLRALDVATFDGFWAFEMERRGADVLAADLAWMSQLDWPERVRGWLMPNPDYRFGTGFALAKELLGSRVEKREISVYDLAPESVGTFDVVFISDLLQHLRDPQAALESVYTVLRPGGHLILGEPYDADFDLVEGRAIREFVAYADYTWWTSSRAALALMLRVAGFKPIEEVGRLAQFGVRHTTPKVIFRAFRP